MWTKSKNLTKKKLIGQKLVNKKQVKHRSLCLCGAVIMPPTLKIGFGLSVCMYVCTYVCTYSCSRYRLETSCMDSSWKNSRRVFLVFPELSPLVKLRPFDKQGDEIL